MRTLCGTWSLFAPRERRRQPFFNSLLTPGQFAIAYAMRLVGFFAEPFLTIGFVFAVVALVPHHFAVAFERHDMGGDTV